MGSAPRVVAIVCIAGMACLRLDLLGQALTEAAFEVASIKRSAPGSRGSMLSGPTPGQFTTKNATVEALVLYSYALKPYQLRGMSGWQRTDGFDIVAKHPAGGPVASERVEAMVRSLLAERFNLAVHRETSEGETYALVLARRDGRLGSGLRRSSIDCEAFRAAASPLAAAVPPDPRRPQCLMTATDRWIRGGTVRLPQLASVLSRLVGRPVIDRTDLDGAFDVELDWVPDLPAAPSSPPSDGVTIFTALQEQLGLRLQPERGPIELLIVDRAEPPTPD